MGSQGLVEVLQAREGSLHVGEVVKGLDGSTGSATHITCRERGGKRRMCVCVCVAIRKWWCQKESLWVLPRVCQKRRQMGVGGWVGWGRE